MALPTTIVLFDTDTVYENLLPLTYTRPAAEMRVGITTLREKWEIILPGQYSYLVCDHLKEKYPVSPDAREGALFIAGNVVPEPGLRGQFESLPQGAKLCDSEGLVAFRGTLADFEKVRDESCELRNAGCRRIKYVFDIFLINGELIKSDFKRLVAGRTSMKIDKTVMIIGPECQADGTPSVFVEEGAVVEGCVLDVKNGPIYIGKEATVMPGSMVKGPMALCDHSVIKMGTKMYGNTTVGPYCKMGGEIDNAVIFGYSNKAHDGYLGNAVIGEWCNIGAGTNASNLKNDYSKIRIWNYAQRRFMRTDLQFCGLIMGDHSKAGINCMFNTATVVGVGVNIHGSGYPRVFIPSFSEGSPEGGFTNVSISKFMDIAGRVMARRGLSLSETDRGLFERIYNSALNFKK